MIARIAAYSGVPPHRIRETWTAADMQLLENVDNTRGLPDRQLVMLLAGAVSGLAGESAEGLFTSLLGDD